MFINNQLCVSIGFGGQDALDSGTLTQALNAAANRAALSFVGNGKTLSKVKIYISATSGSLSAGDIKVALYSDSSGAPGSSIEEQNLATPSGAGWYEATGFTTATTDGTRYWIVVRNANGTPASNHATVRSVWGSASGSENNQLGMFNALSADPTWGWSWAISTDSGSTWPTRGIGTATLRLEWSDATFAGVPFDNCARIGGSAPVYGTREVGAYFTIPASWPDLKVAGLAFPTQRATTPPSGGLRFGLYSGSGASPTLMSYTNTKPNQGEWSNVRWQALLFSTVQTLTAGSTYRAIMGAVSGGDSSNYFLTWAFSYEDNANSRALMPFGGIKRTYYNASSWSETATEAVPFYLLLDPAGEFFF